MASYHWLPMRCRVSSSMAAARMPALCITEDGKWAMRATFRPASVINMLACHSWRCCLFCGQPQPLLTPDELRKLTYSVTDLMLGESASG